jgi:putative ABC transport system substrate-binding protein
MMRRREFIAGLGVAAAWPLVARAQQGLPVIGVLPTPPDAAVIAPFHKGLGEQGYVEGGNVEILYPAAQLRNEGLPQWAAELARRRVAVIFAFSADSALAAKSATETIPIVFATGADPVELGLVASLNRPGGNVTGVSYLATELVAKRLALLHEIAPAETSIGYLVNPIGAQTAAQAREANIAARTLGVRLVTLNASTPCDIERDFAILVEQRIGGLLVDADGLFVVQAAQITALATRHRVPAIYPIREFVDADGLMSYGASISNAFRIAGTYAGRILKSEKPADLPVQRSIRIEMVLNLKAAKALGLVVPPSILALADEVIE